MKRVLSLFLALVLCLSLLPTAAFADGVSITATASKQAPAIGETIDVTFTVANNPGFTNVQLRLAFDSNVLKFTGLKQEANSYGQMVTAGLFGAGTSEANTVVGNEKYGSIGYINTNAINVDNTLFVAQFEVIGQGATTVGAVVQQFQNASGDTVASYEPVVSETGSITVAGIPATSVTLDKTELSLEEGQNYLLDANVDPTNTTDKIVWSSSNESVATVVNGQVKAVSAGNATIKAKANDNAYAECAVTVTAEKSIVHKSPDGYTGYTATAEMTGVKSLVVGGSTKTIKNIYKLPLTGHEGAWVHMDGAGSGQGAAYKLDGTAVFGVPNGVDLTKFSINIDYAYTADLLVTEAELTAAVGEDNVSKLGLSADKLYAFLYIEDPWANRNSGILFEITPVAATGVEVQETMSLYEGETGNLSVSVLPATNTDDLTVTYSSDSEAVATVDANGKVTAVAPGTAVITVAAGSYTDTCTVTVKSGFTEIKNVPGNGDTWKGSVTGITIKDVTVDSYQWNGMTLNVYIADDTATATAIFNFNKDGYDEKFEETAAITNGSGTLSKTFTYNDGWEGYDITWVVNFMKSVPATSIELNKTTLELTKGSNATLTATLSGGSTDTVTWSSSNDSVATVDASGKVTAVGGGTATITATAHEGLTATCTVNVPTLYSVQDIPQVPTFQWGTFEITSLEIDANVESAAWDGDTLKVVLAEGTATDAAISTIWTVKAQNTWFAQDEAHYFFNGNQYGQGATPVTNVHTLAATLTDGAGTATATFEGRADCCDDQACDLSFPAKTYTINFTVAEAGGEEPAPTVALPFTLSMDGEPVAVEVQAGKEHCDVYGNDAAILKIKLPAADMEKDMVLSKSADVNMLYINPLCDWQNATQINQYNPDYTFKPSEYAEYLCVENYDTEETYHIVFESEGGSTEPEQPTANPITEIELSHPSIVTDETTGTMTMAMVTGASEQINVSTVLKNAELASTQKVFWSVREEDAAVASVDQTGKVTALGAGTAVITAKAVNHDGTATAAEGGEVMAQITLTVSNPTAGYTVTMGEVKPVDAGETISIPVTVNHTNNEDEATDNDVQNYKSYEFGFQYDTDLLTLVTGSSEDEAQEFTVVDESGTVTLRRYGNEKNVGEAAVTLEFTAKKTGESDVKLTSAKVGTSADAQDQNIPDAAIIDNLTKITVTGYDVDLDEAFTGAGVADPANDYTFTAKDKNYVYTVDVTVTKPDGTTDTFEVTDEDEDGDLTIPADKITGSIRIEVDEEKTAGKTFNVSIEGTGKSAFSGAETAQYKADYKLTPTEGYDLTGYTIQYKIGETEKDMPANYTIPGDEITGDITITVTAPVDPENPDQPANTWKVSFEGNGAEDVALETKPVYVAKGQSLSFSINKADDYTYIVTSTDATGTVELTAAENGTYTITPVSDVTIKVMKWNVEVNQYVALNGKTVFLVSVAEAENVGLKYDGNAMYVKSVNALGENGEYTGEASDKYVYLVELAGGTLSVEDAARKLNIVENVTCETVALDYNVNESSNLDINDAQLVYDMYNNVYESIATVGMKKFLRADIGGDRIVNVQDAIAVVTAILTPQV